MTTNQIGGILVGALVIVGLIAFGFYRFSAPAGTAVTATTTPSGSPVATATPTAPAVPTVTASTQAVASNSTAVVTAAITPNGSPTSYAFEYGLTSALDAHTTSQSLGSGYISLAAPAVITGLSANTQYFYRVSATNAYGTVTGQTYQFTTNTTPSTPAALPTIRVDAPTAVTRDTANLNGQVTPNGSETSYWFEYGTTSDLGHTTALQSAGSGTITKSLAISVSGLSPLTKYYFRLNAQNQYGTVNGAKTTFITSGPAAALQPTAVTRTASKIAATTATLQATVSANGAATEYWFEYSADPLLGAILNRTTAHVALGADKTQIAVQSDVSGLSTHTKYYFRIVAENSVDIVRGSTASFSTK